MRIHPDTKAAILDIIAVSTFIAAIMGIMVATYTIPEPIKYGASYELSDM